MTTIPSGGFLRSGEAAKTDDANRSTLGSMSDGTAWQATVGSWSANGSQLTTSTARASDPRIVVLEEYAEFDFQSNTGWGDALYFRYQNESNWLRVVHYQDYSTGTVQCNPYTCYYACNPYTCYYACNPYTCYYDCNPYGCNCQNVYTFQPQYVAQAYCQQSGGATYYSTVYQCNSCSFGATCGGNVTLNWNCWQVGSCEVYSHQNCSTCYQQCPTTCYQTCSTTCYQTCSTTCYQNCTEYYYPSYIRLQKLVAGALTDIQTVQLNGNTSVRLNWVRVTGSGSNIKVYSDYSPSTPHINQTVTDHQFATGYGLGRHGYGNQDSGASFDNISLKLFGA